MTGEDARSTLWRGRPRPRPGVASDSPPVSIEQYPFPRESAGNQEDADQTDEGNDRFHRPFFIALRCEGHLKSMENFNT